MLPRARPPDGGLGELALARLLRLVEPGPDVRGEVARRQARYTALTLALMVPVAILALVLTALTGVNETLTDEAFVAAALVAFLVLFPLSRGPRFRLAANVTLLVTAATIWGSWHASPGAPRSTEGLFFLVIPIQMASLVLSSRNAAWFGSLNVLAVLLVHPLLGGEYGGANGSLSPALLLLVVGAIAVNSARVREKDLSAIEAAAAKLAEVDAQRLRMLNTVAHDLASPLTPLKIQMKMIPRDKPLAPERVAVIQRNLAQLERLVHDVKDLARVDAGALRLEMKAVDLADLLKAAKDAFVEDAGGRGLVLEARAEGPLVVQGDGERLTQVLYNLVTNALKFTPPGGQVAIHAERGDAAVRVRVRDTGRGLTPEEMGRLFHPFSQVHERSEVKERGTGLGLYISRQIALAHGGDLHVESEGRGKGSTFTLTLPAQ